MELELAAAVAAGALRTTVVLSEDVPAAASGESMRLGATPESWEDTPEPSLEGALAEGVASSPLECTVETALE